MNVLVIGSGGREHALCWSIAGSPLLTKLWCAPGNPGTAQHAENVPIGALDIAALVAFAQDNEIDLVIPGPEAPLVAGITDAMEAAGIACCGPSRAAAQLEGSKSFTKEICDAAGIPTALWERFDDADAAREFIRRRGAPIVVKADGLAAGKGVVVAATEDEALAADRQHDGRARVRRSRRLRRDRGMPRRRRNLPVRSVRWRNGDPARLGAGPQAGRRRRHRPEHRRHGLRIRRRRCSRRHRNKRRLDGIIRPALAEMARRGTPFRGILYAGLMLTEDGAETDRIQRPLRRSGMPGAAAAADVRPAACPAGRLRRRAAELRSALARHRLDRRGDGGARLPRRAASAAASSAASIAPARCPTYRCSTPAPRPMPMARCAPPAAAC